MSITKILLANLLFLACLFDLDAQDRISGIVSDENGEPLAGVSVFTQQNGRMTGTVTDNNGKYELSADTGAELEFSCIGFMTEKIVVGGGGLTMT